MIAYPVPNKMRQIQKTPTQCIIVQKQDQATQLQDSQDIAMRSHQLAVQLERVGAMWTWAPEPPELIM